MKKQARAEAARLGEWVRVAVARVRGQSVLMAAKARGARTQARRKVTAARQAGREKVQVRVARPGRRCLGRPGLRSASVPAPHMSSEDRWRPPRALWSP